MTVRYACEVSPSGYAVAARRCVEALRTVGVELAWQPLVGRPEGRVPAPPDAALPADLADLVAPRQEGEVLVVHTEPRGWARCREELRPARMIGHLVWETDRLPTTWPGEMQPADALWVPTAWNRAAFEAAVDRSIHVVPHVASTTVPHASPVDVREGTFLVALVSAWDWRKRPDRTIEAFLRAFGPDDDAALVVKTSRWPTAWPLRPRFPTVAHVADLVPEGRRSQVHVDAREWSEAQVLGLVERADCFLSLTASEGWGLGAFDAACLGTPVVITGFGGQVEWLGADHPGLLPYRTVPARYPTAGPFEPDMEWAEADLDAAVDQLRDLAAGRAGRLEQATEALRRTLPDRYSPERVGRLAAAALGATPASVDLAG